MKFTRTVFLFFLMAQPFESLYALEVGVGAGVGVLYTDNSRKTSDNEESDYEVSVDGGITLDHAGEALDLEMKYGARYIYYDRDSQDDTTQINGTAKLQYEQIDQLLFWTLSNSIRSLVRDKQEQDISDNRENRSITTFYPELRMELSRVDDLNALVSYTRVDYEDNSQQESGRLAAEATWQHELSTVSSFDLAGTYEDVAFDNSISDYETYVLRLNYRADLSRLNYELSVGYNEILRDNFEDADGLYLNADFLYESGASQWQLVLTRELTDTSLSNGDTGITDLDDINNSNGAVDVYEVRSAQLIFTTQALCRRCGLTLAVYYVDEDYEILPDDNQEVAVRGGLSYQLSRLSSIDLNAIFRDFSFDNNNASGEDYNVENYNLSYNRTIIQDLTLSTFVAFETRNSNRSYDEASVGVNVQYKFL